MSPSKDNFEDLVARGHEKRRTGDKLASLAAFEAAHELQPAHLGAQMEVVNGLRDLGRLVEAAAVAQQATERHPKAPAPYITLGLLKRATNENVAARAAFEAAISLAPDHPGAHLELINELRRLGQNEQADIVLEDIGRRRTDNAAVQVAMGMLKRRRGDRKGSLAFFQSAASIDPNFIGAHLEMASDLRELGEFDSAESVLRELLTRHPKNSAAWVGVALTARSRGDHEAALAAFAKASDVEPGNIATHLERVSELQFLRRFAEAEELLGQILAKHPMDSRALGAMGRLKRRQGDRNSSLAMFQAAAAAQPSNFHLLLECATDLRDLGRFAEAEDILRRAIEEWPNEPMPLVSRSLLQRRRGNRAAALEGLRAAAAKDPTNTNVQTEIVQELRDLGKIEEAFEVVSRLLVLQPDDPAIVMQQAQLFRRQNRRVDSLAHLERLSQRILPRANLLVEMAADHLALGRPDQAIALNSHALSLEPDNLPALLQQYHIAAIEDDWKEAADVCEKTIRLHPGASAPRINAARAAFELGRREEAFSRIHDARKQLGPLPEIAMRELELLRMMRDWQAVRSVVARERATEPGAAFAVLVHLIQAEINTGHLDRARAELNEMAPIGVMERSLHAHLSGLLAESKFQYSVAAGHYRNAIELNPSDPNLHLDLARLSLITLDLKACGEALKSFTRLTQSSTLRRGLSPKMMQNFVGQLLNEFRLDTNALGRLVTLRSQSDDRQLPLLRELVRDYPDYTAGAIHAAILLRRMGTFDAPIVRHEPAIPKRIIQYWDDNPPTDIVDLMASWRDQNPGYEWLCVSDADAEAFLKSNFAPNVCEAYRSADQPAQKADLFRLAWLAKKGGVYADADDACREPIDSFIPTGTSLAVYQENYGSIANNFIAVVPEHPVIMEALDLAVEALARDDHDIVWLSTGPGLLTRAFAHQWAMSEQPPWLRSAHIMTLGEIQRAVAVHCHAIYKSTTRSWTRASFTRKSRRAATKTSLMRPGAEDLQHR